MDKPLYTQKAPQKSNAGGRVLAFALLFVVFCVLLFVSNYVAYSGIVTLGVIVLFALCTYRLMKNTVFDITYVLYEDRLVFSRRYGKIEMETEAFPLDEAEFTDTAITYEKKSYPFYPDENLKKLLLK